MKRSNSLDNSSSSPVKDSNSKKIKGCSRLIRETLESVTEELRTEQSNSILLKNAENAKMDSTDDLVIKNFMEIQNFEMASEMPENLIREARSPCATFDLRQVSTADLVSGGRR